MEVEETNDGLNDELHFEQRLTKVIMSMPENVRDRFKLLKVISDKRTKTIEKIKELNLKFEKLKAPLYAERQKIIEGLGYPAEYVTLFDQKFEQLKKDLGTKTITEDEDCTPAKVKTTDIGDHKGVPGFWLKALLNHNLIKPYIRKHDEPILEHLISITGTHFEDKHGYELNFTFSPNEYFDNTELKKTYIMIDDHILEKTESTQIAWKDGKDITKKQVKKKQKNKKTKAVRTITKTVEQESFFNFFKSQTMPDQKKLDSMKDDEEEELAVRIDEDFDLGNDIINDVIPEALELYLGVVENDFSDLNSSSDGNNDDNDGEGEGDKDDEDDEKDNKKGAKDNKKDDKPAKKDNQNEGKSGGNEKVECKQQ